MFRITKDAIYLMIILWLILIMTLEFHRFVDHYEYLTSVLKLIYKFKHEQNIISVYKMIKCTALKHE